MSIKTDIEQLRQKAFELNKVRRDTDEEVSQIKQTLAIEAVVSEIIHLLKKASFSEPRLATVQYTFKDSTVSKQAIVDKLKEEGLKVDLHYSGKLILIKL